jgi:hypothetical protein
LGVTKYSGVLGFRDSRYYYRDKGTDTKYGGVKKCGVLELTQEVKPPSYATGVRTGEIGGVGVGEEEHIGRVINYSGVGLLGGVAK